MRIAQAAEATGLTKKAITYDEAEGLVHPDVDPESGYRQYSEDDIVRLELIHTLRMLDVPVSEIRRLVTGEVAISDALRQALERADDRIARRRRVQRAPRGTQRRLPSLPRHRAADPRGSRTRTRSRPRRGATAGPRPTVEAHADAQRPRAFNPAAAPSRRSRSARTATCEPRRANQPVDVAGHRPGLTPAFMSSARCRA